MRRWGRFLVLLSAVALASGAQASVQSELAFRRGVIAYGEGRYADARAQFERVLEENPRDAAALSYLGSIARAEGDLPGAITRYREALALEPTNADLETDLASALLESGDTEGARHHVEAVLARSPDHARARLLAGMAAFRQGEYARALPELERAARDPSVAPHAKFYAGLSEAFLGNATEAAGAFGSVEEEAVTQPIARTARRLREQMRPPSERPWLLDLTTGAEWDSNTTLLGEGFNERDDLRGVLRGAGRFRAYESERAELRLGWDGYLSLHTTEHDVDVNSHVGSVAGTLRFDPVRIGLLYEATYSFVDPPDDFLRSNRLTPSISLREGRWGVTQLYGQWDDQAFFRDPGVNALDRDGDQLGFGMNQYLFLPGGLGYLRAGARRDSLDTTGTEWRFDGHEFSAGAGLRLPRGFELTALYRHLVRNFSRPSVFEPTTERDDRIDRVSAELAFPLRGALSASFSGDFTFAHSSVGVYDYNRAILGTYLTYAF